MGGYYGSWIPLKVTFLRLHENKGFGGSFGGGAGPIAFDGLLLLSAGYGLYGHMPGNLLLALEVPQGINEVEMLLTELIKMALGIYSMTVLDSFSPGETESVLERAASSPDEHRSFETA